jgi:hypothetical protein
MDRTPGHGEGFAKLDVMDRKTSPKPSAYTPPKVERWGTLRELTQGGGGFKNEPGSGGRRTRF